MKKMIFSIMILFSFLSFINAQINGYEYWFDKDVGNKVSYTLSSPSDNVIVNQNIPTNSLVKGIHQLNFRSWDVNNKFSGILTEFFYKTSNNASVNKNIVAYQYWMDNQFQSAVLENVTPQNILNINKIINVNLLQDGLHVFNIRFKDDVGNWGSITSDFFYKTNSISTINRKMVAYQFWTDNNFATATTENVSATEILNVNQLINVNSLVEGLHVFNVRFKDDYGFWSSITSDFFYKTSNNPLVNKNIVGYQYWMDKNFENAVLQSVSPQSVFSLNQNISTTSLVEGLHVFNLRFKDDKGNWSSTTSDFFYKTSNNPLINKKIVAYQYWIDKDFLTAIIENTSPNAILDVSKTINYNTINDGLHLFNVRFKDDAGNWSAITTDFFIKKTGVITPKNIVQYEYWFNEDYTHAIKSHVSPSSTFNLNTFILPQYLTTRNNIFNIRFKDDSGEWSSIISEPFEDITLATVDNTLKNVVFYPNPFEENLNINLGKNYHEITVEIYDFSGKIAYQQKFNNKDLLQLQLRLNSGVYQLILKADDKVTSRKILRR